MADEVADKKTSREGYPNPISMTQDDYVRQRFMAIPKAVVEYLDLRHDDAKANLEVLFKAEYHRYRCQIMDSLTYDLYHNYLAAKAVICMIQNSKKGTKITDELIQRYWDETMSQMEEHKEIPMEFGWKTEEKSKEG